MRLDQASAAGNWSGSRLAATAYLLIAAAAVFRLWYATTLPLSGDEAYHWQWSRHLAAGYYDHPPLTAWLIWVSSRLPFDDARLAVRLPAVLCITALTLVARATARFLVQQNGGSARSVECAGLWAAIIITLTPLHAFFGVYMSTDPSLLLFAMLSLYAYRRALAGGGWGWWLIGGAAFGLAFLSKFLVVLVLPAMAWCALRRRGALLPLAASMLLAAAVTAPFLWWNARNDWATFAFNLWKRHRNYSTDWFKPLEFVLGQLLLLSPGLCWLAVSGIWRRAGDRCLRAAALVPLLFFASISASRRVGGHWTGLAWTPLLILVAVRIGQGEISRRAQRWALWLAFWLTALAHVAPHVPPAWLTWDGTWFSDHRIRVQAITEIHGWPELGARVDAIAAEMRKDTSREPFVMTDQYGLSSLVAFYRPGRAPVHLWRDRLNHGESYRQWDDFAAMAGRDALFVSKRQNAAEEQRLQAHFALVEPTEVLRIYHDGGEVRRFYLSRCYGFDGRDLEDGR